MELLDSIQKAIGNFLKGSALTDYVAGTVTKDTPLEVTILNTMLQLPKEVLILTEPVIEKKIKVEAHRHQINTLSHSHTAPNGQTSSDLSGTYDTQDTNVSVKCFENGVELTIIDGYVTINRGLAIGDKVIMLRVLGGQNFIILSRVF
jgi:hypothetical protein